MQKSSAVRIRLQLRGTCGGPKIRNAPYHDQPRQIGTQTDSDLMGFRRTVHISEETDPADNKPLFW